MAWYRKAADLSDSTATYNIGFMYHNGQGTPRDPTEAIAWYRKAADLGYASAPYNVGVMYRDGQGVPQDPAEAVAWFRKAADLGHVGAMNALGAMYANGRGVPQDDVQAAAWYRRAANAGAAPAMFNLGLMYEEGQGVPQDYVEASKWLSLAAVRATGENQKRVAVARDRVTRLMSPAQIAEAQKLAGEWQSETATDQTANQTDAQFVEPFRAAADRGDAAAMFTLGAMFRDGQRVLQDDVEAYRWMTLATERLTGESQKTAAESRDRVAGHMTPAQIAEARTRAAEWRSR
jgi:TPR repeat protein